MPQPVCLKSIPVRSADMFAVALVLAATTVGCRHQGQPQGREMPTPEVTVAKPLKQKLIEWDEYTGRLAAVDAVEVRARVSGYLQECQFAEGEMINQGDPLFVVDRRPFETELRRANAQVAEAEAGIKEAKSNVKQQKLRGRESLGQTAIAHDLANSAPLFSVLTKNCLVPLLADRVMRILPCWPSTASLYFIARR